MRLLYPLHLKYYLIFLLTLLSFNVAVAEEQAAVNDYKLTQLSRPQSAPDFSLPDMDGKVHTLKQYQGKVVLVNFWATWCPPCIREMPSLEQLHQKLKGKPFVMLAINQWEDEEKVFEFMGQLKTIPTFSILFDADSKISAAYGVKGLPSSFIIDKQGRIMYRATGGRDFNHPEIERTIRSLF